MTGSWYKVEIQRINSCSETGHKAENLDDHNRIFRLEYGFEVLTLHRI